MDRVGKVRVVDAEMNLRAVWRVEVWGGSEWVLVGMWFRRESALKGADRLRSVLVKVEQAAERRTSVASVGVVESLSSGDRACCP